MRDQTYFRPSSRKRIVIDTALTPAVIIPPSFKGSQRPDDGNMVRFAVGFRPVPSLHTFPRAEYLQPPDQERIFLNVPTSARGQDRHAGDDNSGEIISVDISIKV